MAKKINTARGRFIVIDGPDGAGKTTQAKMLAEALAGRGIAVKNLREPGGTKLGEAVRGLLLEHGSIAIDPLAETFLFQAARAQLIREVVRPALEKGEWIVCDRFTLSTLVYQGCAGGIPKKAVNAVMRAAADGVAPDAYFVLWVPPEISVSRRADRKADRMESKGDAYYKKVFDGFRSEARRDPKKYTLIDARAAVDEIRAALWKRIERLLP